MSEAMEDADVPPFDHRRRADLVAKLFVEGMSIPAITQYLESHYGLKVSRDVPYQDIARATSRRWLQYVPEKVVQAAEGLIDKRPEIRDVYVPSVGEGMTTVTSAAHLCASAIYNIATAKIRGLVKGDPDKNEKPWDFSVRIRSESGELSKPVPLPQVDFNKVSEGQTEPEPLKITVRLAFSGGNTMARTCRELGWVLAGHVETWEKALKHYLFDRFRKHDRDNHLPKGLTKRRFAVVLRFVLTNLNAGFDSSPRTNPIFFLSNILNEHVLSRRTDVEIFNAMPFVEVGENRNKIEEIDLLNRSLQEYKKHGFDIILTSAGCLDDSHSTYRRYYDHDRVHQLLKSEGVVGDFMWQPITRRRPFSLRSLRDRLLDEGGRDNVALAALIRRRPMTLLNLVDVAEHVTAGRDVFCVLAPCGFCGLEKSQVAQALLEQEAGLVTHFVLDRGTADATLEAIG